MDVSSWSTDKIMQLPDHAFGSIFVISCTISATGTGPFFDISEMNFPERCIIHGLNILNWYTTTNTGYLRIGLGLRLPTSEADFMLLEPLIHGLGLNGQEPRKIPITRNQSFWPIKCRLFLSGKNRHLCFMAYDSTANYSTAHIQVFVSSVPNEVQEWLISDKGNIL